MAGMLPKSDFLGVPVACCSTREFIEWLADSVKATTPAKPVFVTYLNAGCSNIAEHDKDYARILSRADCVYADGQAIVWASQILGNPLPERVNAADFIPEFLQVAAGRGFSVYLLGSGSGIAETASRKFLSMIPGLKIVGAEPGYFQGDEDGVIARIRHASPDILIVGMGVPMQEKWVDANLNQLNCRAAWCVGAMLEYYGDARLRAPVWVRRTGLEWAFRLVLEPRRLWRRYILGNAKFLRRVTSARIQRK